MYFNVSEAYLVSKIHWAVYANAVLSMVPALRDELRWQELDFVKQTKKISKIQLVKISKIQLNLVNKYKFLARFYETFG